MNLLNGAAIGVGWIWLVSWAGSSGNSRPGGVAAENKRVLGSFGKKRVSQRILVMGGF